MLMAGNVEEQKEKRPIHFYETQQWIMVWHTIGTAKEWAPLSAHGFSDYLWLLTSITQRAG